MIPTRRPSDIGTLAAFLLLAAPAVATTGCPQPFEQQDTPVWGLYADHEYRTDDGLVVSSPGYGEPSYGGAEAWFIEAWYQGDPNGQYITMRDGDLSGDDPALLDRESTLFVGTWFYDPGNVVEVIGQQDDQPIRVVQGAVDIDAERLLWSNDCRVFECDPDSRAAEIAEEYAANNNYQP